MKIDIYQRFKETSSQHLDHPAVYQIHSGKIKSYTYRELVSDVDRIKAHLSSLKIVKGDRVAILSESRQEWAAAYLASMGLGCIVVHLDPSLTADDWEKFLIHSEARVLFFSKKISVKLHSANLEKTSLIQFISFDSLERPIRASLRLEEITQQPKDPMSGGSGASIHPDDPASLIYTSGTTGQPKGVLISHANLFSAIKNFFPCGKNHQGINFMMVPLNHIFGFSIFLTGLMLGNGTFFQPLEQRKEILNHIQLLRPHGIVSIPAFYQKLAQEIEKSFDNISSKALRRILNLALESPLSAKANSLNFLKRIIFRKVHNQLGGRIFYLSSGGALLDEKANRIFNLTGLTINNGYGLSETTAAVTAVFPNIIKNFTQGYPGSVGQPIGEMEIKIHKPNNAGIGEIWTRGPCVMLGYFKNEAETKKVIDSEGWFRTGDLGVLDSDNHLYIKGRIKNVIVTPNGKKVYPQDLEIIFGKLKGAQEVCIFGIPQNPDRPEKGEKVHLQIRPDPRTMIQNKIEDIETGFRKQVEVLSESLPDFQKPRSIGFSNQPFPRSANHKIQIQKVREAFLKDQKKHLIKQSSETISPALFSQPVGKRTVEILKSVLPAVDHLNQETSLTLDLGLDSITLIEFWSLVEKEFRVIIEETQRAHLNSLQEIIQFLEINQNSATAPAQGNFTSQDHWKDQLLSETTQDNHFLKIFFSDHSFARPFFLKSFRKFFQFFLKMEIKGNDFLPKEGPFILAPNHECYLDNIFVAAMVPEAIQREMAVLGAEEFYHSRWTRYVARLCRVVPVDRKNVSVDVLKRGAALLRKNKVLLIHPEGTRSANGRLQDFKPGAALLAYYLKVPLVPVHIDGAHEFWPKGAKLPKQRSQLRIKIGAPIHPPEGESAKGSRKAKKEINELTQELRNQIIELGERKDILPPPRGTAASRRTAAKGT